MDADKPVPDGDIAREQPMLAGADTRDGGQGGPVPPEGFSPAAAPAMSAGPRVAPTVPTASEPPTDPAPRPRTFWSTIGWTLAGIGSGALLLGLMIAGQVIFYLFAHAEGSLSSADVELGASIAGQLAAFAAIWPLWRRVRRRAFGPLRSRRADARTRCRRVAAIAVMGVAGQLFLGYILTVAFEYAPTLAREYEGVMDGASSQFSLPSVLTVAILAPLIEEMGCRGLMFEFFLRAFEPRWNGRTGARGIAPRRSAVAVAVVLQALVFAVLHMNVVQSSYAFFMGLLFGWVYWRTGSLVWSMGLHLVINFSSYAVEPLSALFGPLSYASCIAISGVVLSLGIRAFGRTTGNVVLGERALSASMEGASDHRATEE